ncbi:MAG: helix-turn-helix domain-containing protein [Clostridia bacterium]|nr:helix-turn-helix domain-containing protein [Clostridia bacterium]
MKNFMKHNFNIKKIAIACFVPPGTGAPVHTNRPYHGLAFYTEGECIFKFNNGKELLVSPKSIIYLPKNSNYTVTRSSKNSGCYAINFDLDEETDFAPFIVKVKNSNYITDCFKSAESAWRHKSSGYEIKCKAELYSIIYSMIKENNMEYISSEYAEKIKPAIDYIHHNYTKENISIAELSQISSISEVYFRRVFGKVMGISPIRYINNLKIAHAKELLETQMYSVTKVAELSGFHDESYFSREFKKNIGISPSDYAKASRK